MFQLRAEELTLQEQLAEVEKERAELAEVLEREKKISQELDLEEERYVSQYSC